jgi:hypothetical protein
MWVWCREPAVRTHVKIFTGVAVVADAATNVLVTHIAHHSKRWDGWVVQMPQNHHAGVLGATKRVKLWPTQTQLSKQEPETTPLVSPGNCCLGTFAGNQTVCQRNRSKYGRWHHKRHWLPKQHPAERPSTV